MLSGVIRKWRRNGVSYRELHDEECRMPGKTSAKKMGGLSYSLRTHCLIHALRWYPVIFQVGTLRDARKDFAVSVGHSRGVPLSCTPRYTGTVACCGACQKSTCSATVNTVKLMSILVTFLHIVTKYWARNNLKEEGFLLSHSLWECSPSR